MTPWVCDACKDNPSGNYCERLGTCAVTLEKRIMQAEARMDSEKKDGNG